MIMEFFESHVWKLGSSSFGAFVVPVKYPISPFPRINNLMDWDHLRKFSPFSLWVVMCSEGLSLVPWGETWYGGIDTYYEEYLKFSSFLILDIKSSNQQPHSSRKKIIPPSISLKFRITTYIYIGLLLSICKRKNKKTKTKLENWFSWFYPPIYSTKSDHKIPFIALNQISHMFYDFTHKYIGISHWLWRF